MTSLGRALFVFYAIIGIPICLIFLGLMGERLSSYLDTATDYVAQRVKTRPARQQTRIQTLVSLSLFALGLLFFIFIPSSIFSAIEGWTYGESVYYCFVTLSTVGFGDFVPAQANSSGSYSFYRVCSAAWVLVGLAWVALLLTKTQTLLGRAGTLLHSRLRSELEFDM